MKTGSKTTKNMMQSHRRLELLIAVVVSCAVGTRAFSSLSYPTHQRYGLLRNSHRVQPHAPNRFHIAKITVVNVSWDPFLLDAQVATTSLANSLFRFSGSVPLWQAFGINAALFAALQKKLFQMLTPAGFLHSMALGTGLWATLGWRGWTLCVAYLFLGQAVTKVRFAEKEKLGIAEKRGGRRGPENVWCVMLKILSLCYHDCLDQPPGQIIGCYSPQGISSDRLALRHLRFVRTAIVWDSFTIIFAWIRVIVSDQTSGHLCLRDRKGLR